jgi:hypothetical protein
MEHKSSSPYSQKPTAIPKLLAIFRNMINALRRRVVSTSPNPQAKGPPLVCCPRLLIQYIQSYPPHLESVPPTQPEDAPCRVDRDTLITRDNCYWDNLSLGLFLWTSKFHQHIFKIVSLEHTRSQMSLCALLGFRHGSKESFRLLGCYAA